MRHLVIVPGTHFVETEEGVFSPNDTFFRFAVHFLPHFEHVTLCSPVVDSYPAGMPSGYPIAAGFRFARIPAYWTWKGYARQLPGIVWASYQAFRRAFRGADLVWLRLPSPNAFIAYRAAQDEGRRVVLYVASDIRRVVEERNAGRRWVRTGMAPFWSLMDWMTGRMMRGTVTFALGQDLVEYARRVGGPAARIYAAFPTTTVRSDLCQRDQPPRSPYRLLFVGRLSPEKRVPLLIDAVGQLLAEGYHLTLDVVGDQTSGSEAERVRQRALSLGVNASSVVLHGQISDSTQLDKLYRSASVFVLPSLTEGVPKVIIEAMARSVPVVATRVGGIPELVEDGVNGLLVSPGDMAGLVGALRRLITSVELRSRLGRNAYAFAMRRTAEAEIERLLEIVSSAFPGPATLLERP